MEESFGRIVATGAAAGERQNRSKTVRRLPLFVGCDHDAGVVEKARRNARRAGVDGMVHFETADIAASIPKWAGRSRGLIISNPPYGLRLRQDDPAGLYSRTGELLRTYAGGWEVVFISGESGLVNRLRMRSEKRQKIFNGPLECSLDFFKIYPGRGPGMKGIAHDS